MKKLIFIIILLVLLFLIYKYFNKTSEGFYYQTTQANERVHEIGVSIGPDEAPFFNFQDLTSADTSEQIVDIFKHQINLKGNKMQIIRKQQATSDGENIRKSNLKPVLIKGNTYKFKNSGLSAPTGTRSFHIDEQNDDNGLEITINKTESSFPNIDGINGSSNNDFIQIKIPADFSRNQIKYKEAFEEARFEKIKEDAFTVADVINVSGGDFVNSPFFTFESETVQNDSNDIPILIKGNTYKFQTSEVNSIHKFVFDTDLLQSSISNGSLGIFDGLPVTVDVDSENPVASITEAQGNYIMVIITDSFTGSEINYKCGISSHTSMKSNFTVVDPPTPTSITTSQRRGTP